VGAQRPERGDCRTRGRKDRRQGTEKEVKPKASAAAQAIGLTVSDLTDAQKKELKLKGGVKVDAAAEVLRAPASARAM
jgi:hypothetical protein